MDMDNQKASLEALLQQHDMEAKPPSTLSQELQHNSMLSMPALRAYFKYIGVHFSIILIYSAIFLLMFPASGAEEMRRAQRFLLYKQVVLSLHHRTHANHLIAPADTSVVPKAQIFAIEEPQKSTYVAEPSPEVDEAWNRLLQRQSKGMICPSTL